MSTTSFEDRRRKESLDREAIDVHQLARLNHLLASILPGNEFYAAKLGREPRRLKCLAELAELPFTTKEELVASGAGEIA